MEAEEVDRSQEIKSTNLVEGNCEYLTWIKNLTTERARSLKNSLRSLNAYMETYRVESKVRLNFEGLTQLMVELGYFLYSCRNLGKCPSIEMEGIKVQETLVKAGDKRFSILVFYSIEQRTMQDLQGINLFNGIWQHIEVGLGKYFEWLQQSAENSLPDTQFKTAYKLFRKQFKDITEASFFGQKQKQGFLALEQTNLFYEYSMLYRIRNCSMLEYISSNHERMKWFKTARQRDQDLLGEYILEKKRNRGQPEMLRKKERQIDANLLAFFQAISSADSFSKEVSDKSEKDHSCRAKFNLRIKQREKVAFDEFFNELLEQKMEIQKGASDLKRPLAEMNFYVEYSTERNSICVRLLMPHLNVNVDTSDYLMFQSNVLTYQAVSVSIELSDFKLKNDPRGSSKVITFKGTSSFNTKQPFLSKILLLMDITMIASRIYQPQLNPSRYGQGVGKDIYNKMATTSRKVSHYTKLFMKCARKIYNV